MRYQFLKAAAFSFLACTVTAFGLGGCSGGGDSVVVEGNFPVVFAMRSATVSGNPTDSVEFAPGGDLMMVNVASPSAPVINLTSGYTQGQGDVSDPEVSYDGKKVLFSMRGPNDPTWHIFEMDLGTKALRRIIPDDATANLGDDVDPAYLPDGRIVFTSNRQARSKEMLTAQNTDAYTYLDEYDRERSTVLHVMNADGTDIHQIAFNQSHDRNPTVLLNGQIMFARWDHLGSNNHFPIFTVNPDGTSLFVDYGAFSPGNSFLHPREMPNGKVMSDLMPLSGTHEGGALMGIDILNFSDNNEPVSPSITGDGQEQLTLNQVDFNMRKGLAPYGRYTTPYPLWDGTNRALVSWSPSRPVTEADPATGQNIQTEGNPQYGVYMFDIDKKTLRPIALPPDGWSYVDPIAVATRPVPNTIPDQVLNQDLAAQGLAVINVKSVYDTDSLDIMGLSVLTSDESIPQTTPPPNDMRSSVADIAWIKDPAKTTAAKRPARFLRVATAVPTPSGISRETIGETMLEMQRILGYTEVEPDGSARILVPAETPLALSVVDSNGLTFQRHTNWLQLRPGETRTCNGCHSPRRGVALNIPPIAGDHPNTLMTADPGESMAETRTRLNQTTVTRSDSSTFQIAAAQLGYDMNYVDVWTDPQKAGRQPDPPLSITYSGLHTTAPQVMTVGLPSGFQETIINYPDHIAPLFSYDRGANTCTNCHIANKTWPDLSNTPTGTGRMQSYESLTVGPIVFVNGEPVITINDDGEVEIERETPLVTTGSSHDTSRTSQLFEKMLEKQLKSGVTLPTRTVDHSSMLNASEMRLLAEWADLGGQYYNDPFNVASPNDHRSMDNLRGVTGLSEDVFDSDVEPILMSKCAGCHQAFGGNGSSNNPPNTSFVPNNFVLTGNAKGDYGVTLTMVTDVCTPVENPLLKRPISRPTTAFTPHPLVNGQSVLSSTDPEYQTLRDWIASGTCQ
jgi:hypothetical protein